MKNLLCIGAMIVAAGLAVAGDRSGIKTIGEETLVAVETPHPAPVASTAGDEVWRDVFTSPKASYIAVHFSRFGLALGERVVVATPDGRYAYTFQGEGKSGSNGTFWATHVPGDTCVVTYFGNASGPGYGYRVDRFAHGYPAPERTLLLAPEGTESICGADNSEEARCYQASNPEIYDPSRAVARLLIDGASLCTGWLVGCQGHLLTNAHCITSAADAMNTDFEFDAEGAGCAINCQSQLACPGTIVASTSTLVKRDDPIDYALLLLPVNPTATYGYLKLRAAGAVVDERIFIPGHPGGFGKRIAVASDDPTDQSGFCEVTTLAGAPCAAGGPPDVTYGCDTQGGSSGSPVLAYGDGRVVALHHCNSGGGSCPNKGTPIQAVIASLQASGNLPNCAIQQYAGTVEFDASAYICADIAGIRVKDDSLVDAGSLVVSLASSTETEPESVTLTETPAGSGTFQGSIAVGPGPATNGDALVSVQHGDTLTVTYVDADDGGGGMNIVRMDTAAIDCVAPVISNVGATAITGEGATITWLTNEPANSIVHYGLALPGGSVAASVALATSHAQPVTGLQECSTYHYWVASQDAAGNVAQADDGGNYYSFDTLKNANPSFTSADTPIAIPDVNPTGAISTITVTDSSVVLDVNVRVDIRHTYDADLLLTLIPPSGAPITLANHRGGAGDDFTHTLFDDQATTPIGMGTAPFTGSYKPETPLSAVNGIGAAGAWRLKAVDNAGADVGTIDSWTLTLTYPPGVCGPSLTYQSHGISDACSGGGAGAGDGRVDPGEDVDLSVRLINNGTETVTAITATIASSTPGVSVTRDSAAYPDLPPGAASVSNPPHFAISVDPGIPCGALLDFTLNTTASQGSWSDGFTVRVGARGSLTSTIAATDVPVPIPDTQTINSVLSVSDPALVTDVNVRVNISHTWDSDVNMFLVGPEGTSVELSTGNGGSGDNYTNTVFDDEAGTSITAGFPPFTGTFRPEGSLSVLDGLPANGTWTLRVSDTATGDPGTLNAWSLVLTTESGFVCHACTLAAPSVSPPDVVWTPGSKASLQWSAVAGATSYHVYRGTCATLPDLLNGNLDSCEQAQTASTTTGDILTLDPLDDCPFWYLVRPANAVGLGPAGMATAGPRTLDSTGPCP